MAPRVTGQQITKYGLLRQQGLSRKDAAAAAGFSYSTAYNIEVEGRTAESPSIPRVIDDEVGPPKHFDDLTPVARDCLEDFGRFRFRFFGWRSSPWQIDAAAKVKSMLATDDEEYVVINTPPGGGKTELFTHHIPAWITAQDRSLRGLLGSHGKTVSESYTDNLRTTLSRTHPLQARLYDKQRQRAWDAQSTLAKDYGRFKPLDVSEIWRRQQFTVAQYGETPTAAKESTWSAFSYEAKFLGWRVNFASWDDLVTPAMLRNQQVVEALYNWFDNECETRLEPGGLFVLVGQRLRQNDIYRYALDKKIWTDEIEDEGDPEQAVQKYTHIIYRAHYDELCKGEHRKTSPAWPQGCLLDPVRIGWKRILSARDTGNYETVFQQKDSDPTRALVRREWINGGVDVDGASYEGCWDSDRPIGQLPAHIPPGYSVRYITVDPSPTKWWSCQDWLYVEPYGTERLSGYRYLIDLARKKMGANEFLDRLADGTFVGLAEDWVQRSKDQGYPVTYLIMERNAAQRWAMQYEFFRDWARTRGVIVLEHETTKNKSDPQYGIFATLPSAYRYGRVRLPGDNPSRSPVMVQPLVNEVTVYPDGTTDDCVLSQWFGEYKLPDIVAGGVQVGTIYTDMPSWLSGSPRAGRPGRLASALR